MKIALPIIVGMIGTVILYSYISPWIPINSDSITYLRLAGEIQKGSWHIDAWIRGVTYSTTPLYPALIALMEWVIPGFDTAGTLVAILAASVIVIPLFLLARRFYGEKVAWAAIPLTILNPWYLRYGSLILTESLFSLFFLAAIFLTLWALTRNFPLPWFLAGVMGGAAWMTRDAGIILPFLSILWFAIRMWKDKWPVTNIIKNGVPLIAGILLIYIPLKIVMTIDHKGIPDLPKGGIAFQILMPDLRDLMSREIYFGGLTKDGTEYAFIEAQKKSPHLIDVLRHWDWVIQRFGHNLDEVGESIGKVLGVVLLVLVSAGVFRRNGRDREDKVEFPNVLLFLGSYVLSCLLFYVFAGGFTGAIGPERYLAPLIPIGVIWVSAGIFECAQRFGIKYFKKVVISMCIGIILIVYLPDMKQVEQLYRGEMEDARFSRELGKRLRELSQSYGRDDIVIMARKPFLPYYAGASWFMLPYGEYQEIIRFARSRNVGFLYLTKQSISFRPNLAFLMNSRASFPELDRVLYQMDKKDPEELLTVVYRIKY